jgi:hypothetical protein
MSLPPEDTVRGCARWAMQVATRRPAVDLALLLLSVLIVAAIRLQLLIATDFPLNDGGLFLAFVEVISRVFPNLPHVVHYNGLSIPFAYPPLSFWVSAAAVQLGIEPLAIVHRLPILMNIGYVLLFALLLLRTGHSRLFTALAVLVFGTTFRSYEWLVMGGGLSRGFGSIFLLAAVLMLMTDGGKARGRWPLPRLPRLVAGGACVGAAMLSHLEWGLLAAFSALVCLAMPRPGLAAYVRASLVVGMTAVALVAPWFWWVYQIHGLEPFVAASKTSSWRMGVVLDAAKVILKSSSYLLPFVLLGTVAAARTRDLFWVIFLAAALILTPRGGGTPMVLALAVLATSGFFALWVLLQGSTGRIRTTATAGLVLMGCTLAAMRIMDEISRDENFAALSPEQRSAMAWVAQTHPGSRFAIVKEAPWTYDSAAEWFPVLARAVNATTLQGREWLPGQDFGHTYEAVEEQLHMSTSCEMVQRSLEAFAPLDFVWTEGVDLTARARALHSEQNGKTLPERVEVMSRVLSGSRPPYRGASRTALRGPGTVAGCLEAAGYQEVHSNTRVRIFRVPHDEVELN